MGSADPGRRFDDILANIARIRDYTRGLDRKRFAADLRTRDAVERCLERIAEAARKLGDGYDSRYPAVELPKLRAFGSVLRHDYDGIDSGLVWAALGARLDALEAMCRAERAAEKP